MPTKQLFEIKNRCTGSVIFGGEYESMRQCVSAAIADDANLWGADLSDADLSDADLWGVNLRGADLRDVNLRCADLRGVNLRGANLRGADLRNADLRGADLRNAETHIRAPKIPSIHQSIAAAIGDNGDHLEMASWHQCETTHCRAGWAIHLAGEAGYVLESLVGSSVAGALIYQASDPSLERIPDWAASNEDAMADILAMAEQEKEQVSK